MIGSDGDRKYDPGIVNREIALQDRAVSRHNYRDTNAPGRQDSRQGTQDITKAAGFSERRNLGGGEEGG